MSKISQVSGLPSYVPVIDVSAQDNDPNLDFTRDHKGRTGERIQEHHIQKAVSPADYAAAAQKKITDEKLAAEKSAAEKDAALQAALAKIAELEAEKAALSKPETDVPSTGDDKLKAPDSKPAEKKK